MPRYYLRTYIDRDVYPLEYHPCYFSNETAYISYSTPISIKKTWLDFKFVLNNQFYNEHFTEYDHKTQPKLTLPNLTKTMVTMCLNHTPSGSGRSWTSVSGYG